MSSRVNRQIHAIGRVMVQSLNTDFIPFPINKSLCSQWTDELPYGGSTIIYTSFMYQLASIFKSYEKHLPAFSKAGGSARLASLGKFIIRTKKQELKRAGRILSNISRMLSRAGVEHGYLYDDEPYSGGLLLELGMLDEFREYGEKVLKLFREKGVTRVITVDPHTTNAMRRLREIFSSEIEVANYLELVTPSRGKGEFVLHDPCLYTRYNELGGSMRDVLSKAGVKLKEDRMVTGRDIGTCCGAPLGPIDTALSDRISEYRSEKLLNLSSNVLVACPLCFQNLSPHIENLKDIAEVVS